MLACRRVPAIEAGQRGAGALLRGPRLPQVRAQRAVGLRRVPARCRLPLHQSGDQGALLARPSTHSLHTLAVHLLPQPAQLDQLHHPRRQEHHQATHDP